MLTSLISTVVLFTVFYLLVKIYLEPLYKINLITSQHPKFVSVFVPLMGVFKLYKKSQIEDANHVHWVYKLRQKNSGMRVYVTNIMNITIVNLSCPKLIKNFVNNQNNFKKQDVFFQQNKVFSGLLVLNGKNAAYSRQLMGKQFNFDTIKKNYQNILQITEQCVNDLKKEIGCEKKTIKLIGFTSSVTSKVVTQSFFSQDIKNIQINNQSFESEIVKLFQENLSVIKTFKYQLKKLIFGQNFADTYLFANEKKNQDDFEAYFKVVDQIIDKRIEIRKSGQRKEPDLLDIFLDYKENPTIEGFTVDYHFIKQNFTTLVIAGIDTSSNVAGILLYMLAKHPDIKEKMISELSKIKLESADDIDELLNVKYLQNAINETLRLYTPAGNTLNRVALKDMWIEDLFIRKGDLVTTAIYSLNVDPEVFPEPLKFDPDRWNSLKLEDPFQFIPFSAGSRNCIGQHLGIVEIKVIVAMFLKNFQFEVNQEVKFVMGQLFAAGPMNDQLLNVQAM